ncbi:hypothetical protein RHSIM_RhsimUnG0015300 [Rhododendron simsii]|uniref:Uncharacterized protein n=1 Tax=Rhododendron simsii TaxID=118357 RepID=A0A834G004_RHOSS|nr:hypothetical protein RHSIM_RhsimUnG0015300 [Rhododendron simsii]
MAHTLTQLTAPNVPPISTTSRKKTHFTSLGFQRIWACHHQCPDQAIDHRIVDRRTIALGLAGAVLGLTINNKNANAAARRPPPPPPPTEKKDPNVSGVQAKVLASKKRKEAMKDATAKLREKGKPIGGPSE